MSVVLSYSLLEAMLLKLQAAPTPGQKFQELSHLSLFLSFFTVSPAAGTRTELEPWDVQRLSPLAVVIRK